MPKTEVSGNWAAEHIKMSNRLLITLTLSLLPPSDAFFKDFSAVFAKLVELGVYRGEDGIARFSHLEKGKYDSAPKKSESPGAKGSGDGLASPAAKENEKGIPKAKAKL